MDIKKLRQVETDTMEFSQRLEDSVEVSRTKRSIMEKQDTPDFSGVLIAVNRAGNQFNIYSRVEESGSLRERLGTGRPFGCPEFDRN